MSDNNDSKPGVLDPYEIKREITPDMFQKMADAFVSVEHVGNGAVFSPSEAISAGIRAGNMMAQMIKIASLALARGIITPIELVMRYGKGERYINSTVLMSFLVTYAIARWGLDISETFCNVLLGEVIFLNALHRLVCFAMDRDGDYRHSYSEGVSVLRIPIVDEYLAKNYFTFDVSKLIFEPMLIALLGLSFLIGSNDDYHFYMFGDRVNINPVSFYLLTAALVMFLYQFYCYSVRRSMLLDEKDAAIILEIRAKLRSANNEPGIFYYKGVAYSVLGGKHDSESEKDCPNPDI
jgi:hypothetical protein